MLLPKTIICESNCFYVVCVWRFNLRLFFNQLKINEKENKFVYVQNYLLKIQS